MPLGLLVALASEEWAFRLFVISAPFSDSVIANVGSGDNASGIQIWMFFGLLWLLRKCLSMVWNLRFDANRGILSSARGLGIFALICCLSLVMPLYINGSLALMAPLLLDDTTTPLYLTSQNFTALLYILFGSSLALLIAHKCLEVNGIRRISKLYLGTGVFVALWGIYQLASNVLNLPYPTALFNNNLSASVSGPDTTLDSINLHRVSSVAVEPSILVQVLLSILPLTLPAIMNIGCVFSRSKDRMMASILLLALILTFSPVAPLGIVICAVLGWQVMTKASVVHRRKTTAYIVVWITGLGMATGVLYLISGAFRGLLTTMLLSKAASYSGLERLKTITYAANYFSDYPILGVGWGSVTSHDLVFKLLANVGILGTLAFIYFVGVMMKRGYHYVKLRADPMLNKGMWVVSFIVMMVANALTGFGYVFGHFWLVTGVAIACTVYVRQEDIRRQKTISREAAI
ncbi:MAG TPA: hypothetical protein VEV40_18520 [Alloacidobacterium sp.]|nr:hypothetical protein [Alloacidobacterium sp.]